jgi:hypothetical protein
MCLKVMHKGDVDVCLDIRSPEAFSPIPVVGVGSIESFFRPWLYVLKGVDWACTEFPILYEDRLHSSHHAGHSGKIKF